MSALDQTTALYVGAGVIAIALLSVAAMLSIWAGLTQLLILVGGVVAWRTLAPPPPLPIAGCEICGATVTVALSDEGSEVGCSCGARVSVPMTLRPIRDRATTTKLIAGGVAAVSAVVVLVAGSSAYSSWQWV